MTTKSQQAFEEWYARGGGMPFPELYIKGCEMAWQAAIEWMSGELSGGAAQVAAFQEAKEVDNDMPVGMGYRHRMKVLISCAIEAAIKQVKGG